MLVWHPNSYTLLELFYLVDYDGIILLIVMVKKTIFTPNSQFLIGYGRLFDIFYKFLLDWIGAWLLVCPVGMVQFFKP